LGVKILHVWNTAGVASVIAKFTDREFDTESTVITRKAADRVGLTTYGTAYDDGAAAFFFRALRVAARADIVHVHSLDRIVPWVKQVHSKPVVMHYHGTDIEGRWPEKKPRWSRADYVAVSTPNLLEGAPAGAVHVPNPVDTDIFKPVGTERDPRSALSFRYGMDVEADEAARKLGLTIAWLDRGRVPHDKMPEILSKYAYYIDMRKPPSHVVARSVGKAALEALACGCSVIDWSGKVITGFPPENDPRNVATKWHEIYVGLLKN
jgi:glycosyltransferase involved in cell wall biosynthesis